MLGSGKGAPPASAGVSEAARRAPGLSLLLGDAPIEPFLGERWERSPFFSKGTPARTAALFDLPRFLQAVNGAASTHGGRAGVPLDVRAQGPRGGDAFPLPPSFVEQALALGLTVFVLDLQKNAHELAQLCAQVKRDLSYAGRVFINGYRSPPGGATPLHLDPQAVFTIQLAGTKRWRVSRAPAVEAPLRPMIHEIVGSERFAQLAREAPWLAVVAPQDEASLDAYTLEPGDVLYVPAGVWHTTDTSTGSFSLSLAFEPYGVLELVRDHLQQALRADPAFRASLPVVPALEGSRPSVAHPAMHEFLAARLEAVRAAVAALTPESLHDAYLRALRDGASSK